MRFAWSAYLFMALQALDILTTQVVLRYPGTSEGNSLVAPLLALGPMALILAKTLATLLILSLAHSLDRLGSLGVLARECSLRLCCLIMAGVVAWNTHNLAILRHRYP